MSKAQNLFYRYCGAVGFTAFAVFVRWLLDPLLGESRPLATLYGAVAFAVWLGGWGPALVALVLGYLACDFFFVEPRGMLALREMQHYAGAALFVFSCAIIIGLGEGMRIAEKRLNQVTDKLRIVTESMDAAVARCSRDLRYLWVSKPYADWIGARAEEIIGSSLVEVLGPEAFKRLEPHIQKVLRGEKVTYDEIINYKGRGPRWIHGTYTPTFNAAYVVDGWVAVVMDVTGQRRMEQSLREADRHKDEFLATLAHELRNPLSPIRNAVELLKLNGDDPKVASEVRPIMERQLNQLVALVNDLMDVSRIKNGKLELRREQVRLVDVIHQAVEISRPFIDERRHDLSLSSFDEHIALDADLARLAQVFSNLLNNSARYTDPGGRISLAMQVEGSDVIVSVKDNGLGIPFDNLPFIFDMFAQVEKEPGKTQGGLGIGLTLAKRIVELHGGRIVVESEGAGKGSLFSVRLPIAVSGQRGSPGKSQRSFDGVQPTPCRRILVVDDRKESADSLAQLLRAKGQDVTVVYDGDSAVRAATACRPHIMFIDLGMPIMNGYEVAKRIRSQPELTSIQLVALTGYVQQESRRKASEAGFGRYLLKPASLQELEDILFADTESQAVQ